MIKTGNVIKEQRNEIEDGKYTNMSVNEYDPATGNGFRQTTYKDGKPSYASKSITNERGLKQEIEYNFENGHYSVYESTKGEHFGRDYEFNKNKRINICI